MSDQKKDTSHNNPNPDPILLTPDEHTNTDTIAGLEDFFDKTPSQNQQVPDEQVPNQHSSNDATTDTDALNIEFLNQLGQQKDADAPPSFEIDFEELTPLSKTAVSTETASAKPDAAHHDVKNDDTEQAPKPASTLTDDDSNILAAIQPANNKNKQNMVVGGLFKKEQKATNFSPKSRQKASSPLLTNPKKLNILVLASMIVVILIAGILYMTMFADEPAPTASTQPTNIAPTQEQTAAPASAADSTPSSAPADILPSVGQPNVNPDEILNAQVPSDPALVKEEIDHLSDTNKQLSEQGKLVKEQLAMMEELTAAKAEQIALLEAQIAELEKQKASNAIAPTSANQSSGQSK